MVLKKYTSPVAPPKRMTSVSKSKTRMTQNQMMIKLKNLTIQTPETIVEQVHPRTSMNQTMYEQMKKEMNTGNNKMQNLLQTSPNAKSSMAV